MSGTSPDIWTLAYAAVGFVVGSVPPALAVGRLWGVDVLTAGTENPGISNVKDLAGKTAAAVAFVLDLAVGVCAALVPYWIGGSVWDASLTCVGVVVGRAFSPLLGFRGGRAQMVTLAASVALVPYAGAVFVGIFTIGVVAGAIAFSNAVGLATLWIWTWIFYGEWWAMIFAVTAGLAGLARRLVGSPDGGPVSFEQRLLYDRERAPEPDERA